MKPDYPFKPGPKGYGFPFWDVVTRPESNFMIIGGSGMDIYVHKAPSYISFKAWSVFSTFVLSANVNQGRARFYVATKFPVGFDLDWQPDFFAGKFIACALAYFKSTGHVINICQGVWRENSTNYKQYRQNLRSGMSSVAAALNTWSGRQFTLNGFNEISEADIRLLKDKDKEGKYILAYFYRPKER